MSKAEHLIASVIAEHAEDAIGGFCHIVEIDGTTLEVFGSWSVFGHTEDDCLNGTGAWVADSATVSVDSVEAFDEDNNPVDFPVDTKTVERLAEGLLLRGAA